MPLSAAVFAFNRNRLEQIETDDPQVKPFNRLLRDFDPDLDLVRAKPKADPLDLTPGYWHIRRRNADGVDTYTPIKTPDGNYREPDLGVIQALRLSDTWNPVYAERRRKARQLYEHRQEFEREDRRADMADRLKTIGDPHALVLN